MVPQISRTSWDSWKMLSSPETHIFHFGCSEKSLAADGGRNKYGTVFRIDPECQDRYVDYGTLNQRAVRMTNILHTHKHPPPWSAVPHAVIFFSILRAQPLMANLQAFGVKGHHTDGWKVEGLINTTPSLPPNTHSSRCRCILTSMSFHSSVHTHIHFFFFPL